MILWRIYEYAVLRYFYGLWKPYAAEKLIEKVAGIWYTPCQNRLTVSQLRENVQIFSKSITLL